MISLVVPSRNNLKYVKFAYNSIRKYLGPKVEVVLMDDASNDGTWEWITELSERVGRRCYMPELLIEHLHPAVGKAPMDVIYTTRKEVPGDIGAFYKELEPDRIRDADKLKNFIKIFQTPTV